MEKVDGKWTYKKYIEKNGTIIIQIDMNGKNIGAGKRENTKHRRNIYVDTREKWNNRNILIKKRGKYG